MSEVAPGWFPLSFKLSELLAGAALGMLAVEKSGLADSLDRVLEPLLGEGAGRIAALAAGAIAGVVIERKTLRKFLEAKLSEQQAANLGITTEAQKRALRGVKQVNPDFEEARRRYFSDGN